MAIKPESVFLRERGRCTDLVREGDIPAQVDGTQSSWGALLMSVHQPCDRQGESAPCRQKCLGKAAGCRERRPTFCWAIACGLEGAVAHSGHSLLARRCVIAGFAHA